MSEQVIEGLGPQISNIHPGFTVVTLTVTMVYCGYNSSLHIFFQHFKTILSYLNVIFNVLTKTFFVHPLKIVPIYKTKSFKK